MRTVLIFVLLILAITMPAQAADDQAYQDYCAACHLPGGAGMEGLAPGLKSDLWTRLGDDAPDYFAAVLASGMAGIPLDGRIYANAMPPWDSLSDEELTAIGNYILVELNGLPDGAGEEVLEEVRKGKAMSRDELLALREGK